MKCPNCGGEIKRLEMHDVFYKGLDEVSDISDLYENYDCFDRTELYCPLCNTPVDEEKIVEILCR